MRDIDTAVVDSLKVLDPRRPIREDIDTAVVDSLKVLDPRRPIREADIRRQPFDVRFVPRPDLCSAAKASLSDHLVGAYERRLHDEPKSGFHSAPSRLGQTRFEVGR